MDRNAFSNSRRARHFLRSNQPRQNFQASNNKQDNYRKNLRDAYLSETHGGDHYNSTHYSTLSNSPNSLAPSYCDDSALDLSLQLAGMQFEDSYSHLMHDQVDYMRNNRYSSLPDWALDENCEIRHDLTLEKVIDEGLVVPFSMDKSGCHFLQSNYFGENTQDVSSFVRERISREVLGSREVFVSISKNVFGNFFLQRVIEYSALSDQEAIKSYIVGDIAALCLDKSGCRVVQTALEKLEPHHADDIVASIPHKNRLMAICTDQNANHVIQKITKKMRLSKWEFLITYLCKKEHSNLLDICQDKYGCRVVQTIVEVLSEETKDVIEAEERAIALRRLMQKVLSNCSKLASNEFANYVIQHIIETPGILSDYRNAIIEMCLLRSLLSLSQEKYASHVVERAFVFAPLSHIAEMMEEIFDGYVPHPESGKDALDILMFHQFGNYVVQRMLRICVDAVTRQRDTIINGVDYHEKFEHWLAKLYVRARKERIRLSRFSSGKKILDILQSMEEYVPSSHKSAIAPPYSPVDEALVALYASSFLSPTATTTSGGNDFPSRSTSLSSDLLDFDYNFNNYPKF